MNGPEFNPRDDEQWDRDEYEAWEKSHAKESAVFTHCNVCGVVLRTEDEERMGMCEKCAAEGP